MTLTIFYRRGRDWKNFTLLFLWGSLFFCSCEEFAEVGPPKNQLINTEVFDEDETANSALIGIYAKMMRTANFASINVTLSAGLSADEFVYWGSDAGMQLYTNTVTSENITVSNLWRDAYRYIYDANAVLEGLARSTGISGDVKEQLEGEARFIRAFCHFYLVNLFGAVPWIATTDYRVNSLVSRLPPPEVYTHITADLEAARKLLPEDYNHAAGERVRPNRWAATALLARVYLYTGDWEAAEHRASEVINAPLYALEKEPGEVFSAASAEMVWQLKPVVGTGRNTWEGSNFILTAAPDGATLSSVLLDAFEQGDKRKESWVNEITIGPDTYYFPYKYKVKTREELEEYYTIFRLAEQYLVRAEARAQQGHISGAKQDLNTIRSRAGLENTTAVTKEEVLEAIVRERRVEFFAEWGHRWLDLKRTGKAGVLLPPVKQDWQATDALYPVPEKELQNNPNMEQNPGY